MRWDFFRSDQPCDDRVFDTIPIPKLWLLFQIKPLIWIESVIERHAHSRVEIMVKAKSQFKRRSTANNVEIFIHVPSDADSPKFKTTIGHCKYVPEQVLLTPCKILRLVLVALFLQSVVRYCKFPLSLTTLR